MSTQNKNTGIAKYTPTQFFKSDKVKNRFEKVLGEKATGFVTSVLQVINDSNMLQNVDTNSIFNAAMTAATLDLPINPNLGFAYIIPYKGVAQFQMGYKGYIQLCQRSGLFKTISATPIYEGQISEENPLTGFEFNFKVKHSDKVVGYASYFELLNGFQKTLYMTVEEVEAHALEYSQSYKGKDKKGSSPWYDNFDSMALKTVLKLLLSKYAPMTVDMQKAVQVDQAEIKDPNNLQVDYPDNPDIQPPPERQSMDIEVPDAEYEEQEEQEQFNGVDMSDFHQGGGQ